MSEPRTAGDTWCGELELSGTAGLRGVVDRAPHHVRARILVRLHGDPVGYVTVALPADTDALDVVLAAARTSFASDIDSHLRAERASTWTADDRPALPSADCPNVCEPAGLVSIVVGTRNRSALLATCLEHLAGLTYPDLEFLIVDNAPTDDSTQDVVEAMATRDSRFTYLREQRPGLSQARNCGLARAQGRFIAFTDDDVVVDPAWIDGLVRGFARSPRIACVTGIVASATLDSAAEEYFDAHTPMWSTRCQPDVFCADRPDGRGPLFPYSPGLYGTGASMAFDREFLLSLGGFDLALGAGTRSRGGEDLDIFLRTMETDRCIAYEAAAVVWHHHRADWASLENQMFGYGSGLTACLTKILLRRASGPKLLRRLPYGLTKLRSATPAPVPSTATAIKPPAAIVRRERLGMLAGPALYFRARAASARAARR